jgi:hypothetical protein
VQKLDRQANNKKNREIRSNVGMYFGHHAVCTVQSLRVMCSLERRYVDFGIKNAKFSRSLPTSGLFFILSALRTAMYGKYSDEIQVVHS